MAVEPAIDLGKRYPATLDYSAQADGYPWTCTPKDIWRLKEFRYAIGTKFAIKLGPSQVVFGCHGTNVLWAVVIPDQPGEIVAASAGKGEHITSIWLRFHPGRVGELLPAATVAGPGDAKARPLALLLAAHKLTSSLQSGNLPMVPPRRAIIVDIETREGRRRYFGSMDTAAGEIRYFDALRGRTLPAVKRIDPTTARQAFDAVWNAFDQEYAMFAIKPQVDWAKLRETYYPRAAAATTNQELAVVLREMLDHLEDLHVYVQLNGTYVPGYWRDRPLNANPKALGRLVGPIISTRHDLEWGRTGDGIGYINVRQLGDVALPETFDEVLGQMADTKGLILDLRYNGGGSEPLGCAMTGRLLDRRRVYSKSQFRNGPKHSDLGPKMDRDCGPAGPWHYVGPVVVLQGQKTMSSAESFALALAQCPQVTTMGDRTAGSSGNPRRLEAGAGIVVNLPRWIDMDPQGKPIDVVGIAPRVKIDAKPEDFRGEQDPVLAAALERLRTASKVVGTPPGSVLQQRPGVPRPADRPKVVSVSPAPDATNVDPLTEIRIRFDRPMDPNLMGLHGGQGDARCSFRLRGPLQYRPQDREFVFPVVLEPGTRYTFSLGQHGVTVADFRSSDGTRAGPYSWRFTTRAAAPAGNAPKPRVLAIEPPSGAETGMVTAIRIRFDRPMDPNAFMLADSPGELQGVSVPFPVEYDAPSRSFTFHALFPSKTRHRIELRGFRGADGGEAEPATVEYKANARLYSPEQRARIAEAGRSAKLREVVEAVRRNRLAMKSVEELVRTVSLSENIRSRPGWCCGLEMNYARFAFQAERQFYADITSIIDIPFFTPHAPPFPFCLGSDGRECWFLRRNQASKVELEYCPADAMRDRHVLICDPFGSKRFPSAELVIERLKLEYLGTVTHEGKTCHRIHGWAGERFGLGTLGTHAYGFHDWLIDAQTLLPVLCQTFGTWSTFSEEFVYERVNQPMSDAAFRAPAAAGASRRPSQLEAGYDRLFLTACDGSDGRMSVSWGEKGAKGTKSGGMN
jgi:hypothetical protein